MRTVLLCRRGGAARYLAHRLHRAGRLDAVVVEEGGAARRRKLRRELRKTPWWRLPLRLLDFAALAVYGRIWRRYLTRKLLEPEEIEGLPDGVPAASFDDANDEAAVAHLRALAPDVLVVLGTSILKPDVLEIPRRAALNVHGGIVPAYRNVHSEAWAVLRGDRDRVGSSVIHLDEGIDSGGVALQRTVESDDPESGFLELRLRNVRLGAELVLEALDRLDEGALPREDQDEAEAGFHPTPGFRDLLSLWWKTRRSR